MIKCKNCGYSLQIEHKVCPGCGTPNPFFTEHREDMEKYSKAYEQTEAAVIGRVKKTTGTMVKLIIALVLILAGIVTLIVSGKVNIGDLLKTREVQSHINSYREEYTSIEASGDFVLLKHWFEENNLNRIPQFADCLNVYNVCLYYEGLEEYLMEITFPEYMKNAVRSKDDYCDSIIESYEMMAVYAQKEAEAQTTDVGHAKCIIDCVGQARMLIQATFKFSDEEMNQFDSAAKNTRIGMLLDKWPYAE